MKLDFINNWRQLDFGATAGLIAADAALAGQGIQAGTAATKNKRQYNYQKKLMDYQAQKNQAMAMFNQEQQLKLWKDTGPVGQMEQLKTAGLNPGLIYGMGGAGGQTAAAAQAAGVSGGSMDVTTGTENMGAFGMMMGQAASKTAAEIDLMKAQAENLRTQSTKTGGADTQLTLAQTGNVEADTILKNSETKLKDIQLKFETDNFDTAIETAKTELNTQLEIWDNLKRENKMSEELYKTNVDIVEQKLANMIVEKGLDEAKTQLAKSGTALNEASIKKMAEDIAQGWTKINNETMLAGETVRNNAYNRYIHDITDKYKLEWETANTIVGGLGKTLGNIKDATKGPGHVGGGVGKGQPISGFGGKH